MKIVGKIMPRPMGVYNPEETYNILDMVTHNNKVWIAKKSGLVNMEPTIDDTVNWILAIDGKIDVSQLEDSVLENFETVGEQITELDTHLEAIDAHLDTVDQKMTEFEDRINNTSFIVNQETGALEFTVPE